MCKRIAEIIKIILKPRMTYACESYASHRPHDFSMVIGDLVRASQLVSRRMSPHT